MSRTKIYINGRFLGQRVTGVQRYAIELVKSLNRKIAERALDSTQYDFCILVPPNHTDRQSFSHIPVVPVGSFSGHLWEQLSLPFHARNGLLINFCNTGPVFKRNQVATIHDTAVFSIPYAYSLLFRTFYKMLVRCLGKQARIVLTVSKFSRVELTSRVGISGSKIHVINNGIDHVFATKPDLSILQKFHIDKPYIFSVSSINPSKNFKSTIAAFQLLQDHDIDLVIAGGWNSKIFTHDIADLPSNIKFLGYVSDQELKALYQGAVMFIFPSLYEGFGIPPLEAMACGCPVVVSNVTSLPEVNLNAAMYCDPYRVEDIAEKIRVMLYDESLRKYYIELGYAHTRKFSWDKSMSKILQVIKQNLLTE